MQELLSAFITIPIWQRQSSTWQLKMEKEQNHYKILKTLKNNHSERIATFFRRSSNSLSQTRHKQSTLSES